MGYNSGLDTRFLHQMHWMHWNNYYVERQKDLLPYLLLYQLSAGSRIYYFPHHSGRRQNLSSYIQSHHSILPVPLYNTVQFSDSAVLPRIHLQNFRHGFHRAPGLRQQPHFHYNVLCLFQILPFLLSGLQWHPQSNFLMSDCHFHQSLLHPYLHLLHLHLPLLHPDWSLLLY